MENKEPVLEFGIERIQDMGFQIYETIPPSLDSIGLGYGMNFVFDIENNWVEFLVKAQFDNLKTMDTFMHGTVLTRFSVKELNKFTNEKNMVVFPTGSLESMFGIAFSHMRAILSKNVAGSRFKFMIVPVVNPFELFPQLLKDNMDNSQRIIEQIDKKGKVEYSQHVPTKEEILSEQLHQSTERIKKLKKLADQLQEEKSKK